MRNGLKYLERCFSSQNISYFRSEILEVLQDVRLEKVDTDAIVERIGDFSAQLRDPLHKLEISEEEVTEKLSLFKYLRDKDTPFLVKGIGLLSMMQKHLYRRILKGASLEENVALVDSALTDPDIFQSPTLYAVDLDVLEFAYPFQSPSSPPVLVHVSFDSVFTTHDMLADWKKECEIPVVRIMETSSCDAAPSVDAMNTDIEALRQILSENNFARYAGVYPGKKYSFLVSCPNERCRDDWGCQTWRCQECEEVVELAVRSDVHPDRPNTLDTLICSRCKIIALPEKADFRCSSVATHGLKFHKCKDRNSLSEQIKFLKENCINIVILGETGVGKSTFINAFANYLQSQSLQDMLDDPDKVVSLLATEFQRTDPSTGKLKTCKFGQKSAAEERAVQKVGASFTQTCKTYSFSVGNVMFRIVDTPSMVDVRGVEQDNRNIDTIMSYLQHFDKVHAFLFLFRADTFRMQPAFVYCFKAFLNKLHKDAARNIIFVNSRARPCLYSPSGTASILDQILGDIRRESKIELYRRHDDTAEANDFYIDSEAFRLLVAHRNGIRFSDHAVHEFSASWDHSSDVYKKIFEYARTLPPHNVSSTISIHLVQVMYQALVRPMAKIQKTLSSNMERAKDEKERLKNTKLIIEDLKKKVYMDKTFLETTSLPHPRTVCTYSKCTTVHDGTQAGETFNEYRICHDKCYKCFLESNITCVGHPKLMKCAAFYPYYTSSTSCDCGHTFHYHMHTNLAYKQVVKSVENPVIKRQIEEHQSAEVIQHDMILENNRTIATLERSKAKIEETSVQFVCYLAQHSIVPVNDSLIMHLDTEIQLRENNPKSAPMLKSLRDWKRSHEEQISDFESQRRRHGKTMKEITIEEIDQHMKEMFELPEYGAQLRDTYNKITEIDSSYQEVCCVALLHQLLLQYVLLCVPL